MRGVTALQGCLELPSSARLHSLACGSGRPLAACRSKGGAATLAQRVCASERRFNLVNVGRRWFDVRVSCFVPVKVGARLLAVSYTLHARVPRAQAHTANTTSSTRVATLRTPPLYPHRLDAKRQRRTFRARRHVLLRCPCLHLRPSPPPRAGAASLCALTKRKRRSKRTRRNTLLVPKKTDVRQIRVPL